MAIGEANGNSSTFTIKIVWAPCGLITTDGTERDPVAVYKIFARKRPKKINLDDATWPAQTTL